MTTSKTRLILIGIFFLSSMYFTVSCAPPPVGTSISSGQTKPGIIEYTSDQERFYFTASEGDTAIILVSTITGSFTPGIYLRGPEGEDINSVCASTQSARLVTYNLPSTGIYNIIVLDCRYNADTLGEFNISLIKIPGAIDGKILSSGETASDSIDPVGDMDGFKFNVNQSNNGVLIQASRTSGNLTPGIYLFGETGNLINSVCSSTGSVTLETNPLQSETHTIVVLDCRYDADTSGDYHITLTKY